jgi:3-dehydrosphinganine reductase
LITGGSSGIGLATARECKNRGAHVAIIARDPDKLERARRSLVNGGDQKVIARSLDVSDAARVERELPAIIEALGGLDVLVCNAGTSHASAAQDTELDVYRRLMDVNFFGTVHVTRALLSHFMKQGHGHIAAVSSVAGFLGVYGYTAYSASKYAVTGYMETLRQELLPHGVGVSIIFPGDTDTPQLRIENESKPEATWVVSGNVPVLSAETVARALIDGIVRSEFHIVPGLHAKMTYLAQRHAPQAVRFVIDRQLTQLGPDRAPRVRRP